MATLGDFLALITTIAVFGGVIYVILKLSGSVSEGVKSTKVKLKEKGYDISDKGVSVKTSKRMNREDYVDATQRGLIRALGASSFGNGQDGNTLAPPQQSTPPTLSRTSSSDKKKRSFFTKKKHDDE
ncbi:hypothetical protein BDP27DRAFT_1316499 [Rhodocollybia butyracea]|uniref:Uncharacterized protein n=1 Tax=Rhodocollybia butyracea TaxID=206335 RepID=A0A9P5PY25_9AGAR|nr:hypothetical protein BDP27DRAFT_1316499 [Rhodocollybia butyracea]